MDRVPSGHCRPCNTVRSRKWAIENPDRVSANRRAYYESLSTEERLAAKRKWNRANPVKRKAAKMKLRYGIELADYERLCKQQDGRCSVCLMPAKLVIDHCHTTGVFRGLLCMSCNFGLGNFKDSVPIMRAALRYLESNGCT